MVWETHVAFYDPADGMVTCLSFNGSESAVGGDQQWAASGPMAPASVPKEVPNARTTLKWCAVTDAGRRILGWSA